MAREHYSVVLGGGLAPIDQKLSQGAGRLEMRLRYSIDMVEDLRVCIPVGPNGADRDEAAISLFHALPSKHHESACIVLVAAQDILWWVWGSDRASRIVSESTWTLWHNFSSISCSSLSKSIIMIKDGPTVMVQCSSPWT
ncbi:hypothetical protein H6P81_001493 [Aristolochia fimbriata]|uniref:Uncharacterized protein n=1 Tax=Aristolochia fimbriata TaxID=158543 RepID=A0AAV7F9R3_ARIFI|nr:hypothetical protein H6P81_001493 [Aristolochia fimbriata]